MIKIENICYEILKKEYGYKGEWPDIYEAQNFFKDKLNLNISAVKVCGPTDLSEHWNCFVNENEKIIFQDAWSLDFDYEEVINLCIYYYFVDKGFISIFGGDDND